MCISSDSSLSRISITMASLIQSFLIAPKSQSSDIFFHFFLARVIAVMSIISICLVCNFSIVATCPSMPAARFAFCLWFVCFFLVLLFIVVLAGEPKQNQGRGLVDRKLVLAPTPLIS